MRVLFLAQPVEKLCLEPGATMFRYAFEGAVQRDCKPNSVFAFHSGENHLSQQPNPSLCSFRNAERTAPRASYLALHPAGFSVPQRSHAGRWSLTPPFHPYRTSSLRSQPGGIFSVALSVSTPLNVLPTCTPACAGLRGAASCGVRTFLFHSPLRVLKAILRPSEPANIIPQSNAATTNFPTPRSPSQVGPFKRTKRHQNQPGLTRIRTSPRSALRHKRVSRASRSSRRAMQSYPQPLQGARSRRCQ